ncbi:MAG TPA: hypothetical protein VMM92_06930 [Thermoanaerobaculia bacterium]|nr:hypothetical protein [Thermoanaerobaculia bacterium]
MNRKAFRCGVLALLLGGALALPAAPAVGSSRFFRSAASAGAREGWLNRLWELAAGFLPGARLAPGLTHMSGANREGIDPNGALVNSPGPGPGGGGAGVGDLPPGS